MACPRLHWVGFVILASRCGHCSAIRLPHVVVDVLDRRAADKRREP